MNTAFPLPRWLQGREPLTVGIIAINVGVWLASVLVGGLNILSPSPADLQRWGGNIAALSLTSQPWRLFTNIFIHAGAIHILSNMWLLLMLGWMAVRAFGRGGYLLVYLVGGVLASLASAWWQATTMIQTNAYGGVMGLPMQSLRLIVSVGASGAIFAVCGALLAYMARTFVTGDRVDWLNPGAQGALLRVVGINIALGFAIGGIDQSAHVGGLLAGLALGTLLPASESAQAMPLKLARYAAALAMAAGLVVLVHGVVDQQSLHMVEAQLLEESSTQSR